MRSNDSIKIWYTYIKINNNLINDFVNQIRATVEALSLEVLKTNIDPKDALAKVKSARADMTHLYNLLKFEEDIAKERVENL